MTLQRVILVDIDGTLVQNSLEHWFLTFLLRTHHVKARRLLCNLVPFLLKWPPPNVYQFKLMYLRAYSVDIVQQWIQTCWKSCIQARLFHGVIKAVEWFQSVGARVVLLSGTPRPLAEPLMDYLQVRDIICAEPEIQDRVYTGRLLMPHPKKDRKVKYACEWLQARGYKWSQVVAIANHWYDRFLLEHADHSVVIQPDRRLRRHAENHQWIVIDTPYDPNAVLSILHKDLQL